MREYVRVKQAAARMKCSKSFVRTLIAEGYLPARRAVLPGRPVLRAPLLIAAEDLEKLIEQFPVVERRTS